MAFAIYIRSWCLILSLNELGTGKDQYFDITHQVQHEKFFV